MDSKCCPKCTQLKPVSEFYRSIKYSDGLQFWCKECQRYSRSGLAKPRNHGESQTPLYRVWRGMRNRCSDPKASNYRWYGGRGVRVCAEWETDFLSFKSWSLAHGYEPGMQIDRVDTDGNYEPRNCRWTTRIQNLQNRRQYLPVAVERKLQRAAKRSGVSVYVYIRHAVEEKLERDR